MTARYAVCPDVAWEVDDRGPDLIAAAVVLPDGELQVLLGSGGAIWVEATSATEAFTADEMADRVGATAQDQRVSVRAFLEELTALGLLVASQ